MGRRYSTETSDKSKNRMNLIVETATRRFANFGYEKTTMRDIASDVGILPGSLYYYFENKESLLLSLILEAVDRIGDESLILANSDAEPENKLIAMINLHLTEQIGNYEVHAILYNERMLLREKDQFSPVLDAKRKSYRAWRLILQEGVRDGLFDPELDMYQMIRTIVRMLNSASDGYMRKEETASPAALGYSLEEVRSFYVRFIVGAVRSPKRSLEAIREDRET